MEDDPAPEVRTPEPTREPELTGPVQLCRSDGTLDPRSVGWTRRPLHRCGIPGRWGRRKRWDYWAVTADPFVLSVTVADVDYLSMVGVWAGRVDDGGREVVAFDHLAPPGRAPRLPDVAGGGDVEVAGPGWRVALSAGADGSTRLELDVPVRGVDARGRPGRGAARGRLEAAIDVALPDGHETLGVVIPWSSRRFQYTSKHEARPAAGEVRIAGEAQALRPAGSGPGAPAWGTLDVGRGVWPYRVHWNWGAGAAVLPDGRTLGLQLGGRWTDGTGMTENAVVVDGHLSKLGEDLVWDYDLADPLAPWRVTAPRTGRVDLTLTPVHDRATSIQAVVAMHRGHQVFGHWSGTVVADDGERIEVPPTFGWGEDVRWRW